MIETCDLGENSSLTQAHPPEILPDGSIDVKGDLGNYLIPKLKCEKAMSYLCSLGLKCLSVR